MPVYFGDQAFLNAPIVIAYRHAHRHFEDPTENGGLSELGEEQAQDAAKKICELFLSYTRKLRSLQTNDEGKHFSDLQTLDLWSSPKTRCKETISFLDLKASKKQVAASPVDIREELDEQQPHESSALFQQRIQKLLDKLESKAGMTVLCTHGDWIPKLHSMIARETLNVAHAQAHVYMWQKSHHEWKYCGFLD